ncbi:trehalose-phosphatase (plasmid) [Roseobacteraceae bacterium NS-SX3]
MTQHLLPAGLDPARHAFFLDFDGTLAPIVKRPQDAAITAQTRGMLHRLISCSGNAVAILSGRPIAEIDERLEPMQLAASGSHGTELRGPDGIIRGPDVDHGLFDTLHRQLQPLAEAPGLLLERKPGAIAVHYRQTPGAREQVISAVDCAAASDGSLRALHGNMVSEVALAGSTKGTALKQLAAEPPFRGRLPVMAGDDVTDEDGFAAAQELGGFAIRIGPGQTVARYRSATMEDFLDWLAGVAAAS